MLKVIATTLLAATSAIPAFAAGQTGEPHYFVKAWLQNADKSFEHTTGWCDGSYFCSLTIGEYAIELREVSSFGYVLAFSSAPFEPTPCCVFKDGRSEARLSGGRPHVRTLYYTPPETGAKGAAEFGKIIILVEGLRKPEPDWWEVKPVSASSLDILHRSPLGQETR
ncbi:hypothetical protein PZN02_003032 [Sinorhizobium garamanticum]|uniref:Uncharacterized protein n=1 Tax=Sinorhizobium garamanticum TaxID=680247 RepID=A0ABY8D9G5_9HYPH|nr:hypothetical protein [Sinorhizobium garamanticum]WEX86712.1 hypothetical protein PZN02_003032 [Sinorhizobium garamanticum]